MPLLDCFPPVPQDTKQLELKGLMMASYHLRHRMLHFMQNLVYYMMVEVGKKRGMAGDSYFRPSCWMDGCRGHPSEEVFRPSHRSTERERATRPLDIVSCSPQSHLTSVQC